MVFMGTLQLVSSPIWELASSKKLLIFGSYQNWIFPFPWLAPHTFFRRSWQMSRDVTRQCKVHNCWSWKQGNSIGLYAVTHILQSAVTGSCPLLLSVLGRYSRRCMQRGLRCYEKQCIALLLERTWFFNFLSLASVHCWVICSVNFLSR